MQKLLNQSGKGKQGAQATQVYGTLRLVSMHYRSVQSIQRCGDMLNLRLWSVDLYSDAGVFEPD